MNLNYYMKCSNCGKEFGDGIKCQNCGVDRVTGLGNYSGYNVPSSDVMDKKEDFSYTEQKNHSIISQYHIANVGSIVCYACGEVIPEGSTFCPYCKKKLLTNCQKCGNTYSTQYSVCNKCGTDRYEYYKEMQAKEKEDRKRQLEEARKKQAQEKEERYKREAQDIKEKFPPSVVSISTILISAWILFCLTPLWPFSGYGNLLVIIGVSILLWGIAAMICGAIGESKIKNWKEEHPNDPRSKYL